MIPPTGRHRRLVPPRGGPPLAWTCATRAGCPPPASEGVGLLTVLGGGAVALYAFAAWRSVRLYLQRGGTILLSVAIALILLAEAMIAVVLSRNWRLSWWEWHVLMLAAFALIALGAREEYRRSGTLTGAFGGLYLEQTLARIDRWYAGAITAVVAPTPYVIARRRVKPAPVADRAGSARRPVRG